MAEILIFNEGDGDYSVQAGFSDVFSDEIVLRQRSFRTHPEENPNSIGLLARAIEKLGED